MSGKLAEFRPKSPFCLAELSRDDKSVLTRKQCVGPTNLPTWQAGQRAGNVGRELGGARQGVEEAGGAARHGVQHLLGEAQQAARVEVGKVGGRAEDRPQGVGEAGEREQVGDEGEVFERVKLAQGIQIFQGVQKGGEGPGGAAARVQQVEQRKVLEHAWTSFFPLSKLSDKINSELGNFGIF